MNTHRLHAASFDAPTQPAVHDRADTQWPAFTQPMNFDGQPAQPKPEVLIPKSMWPVFAIVAIAVVAASRWHPLGWF